MTRSYAFPLWSTLLTGLASATLLASLAGCGGQPAGTFIAIGTGGVTGVYYPVGSAMAKLVNDGTLDHGLRASVESTGGSVFNINAVLNGDLDFGICQTDRAYQAAHGQAEWEGEPREDLRAVCGLYTEMVTLVGADDAGIETAADLKGKRVNIGNPGSGSRGNAIDVLEAAGLDWENDIEAQGIKSSESAKLLQDGRIDAFFFTAGHPAGSFMEATAGRRKVRIIPIESMDTLIEKLPYYREAKIPVDQYPNALNEEPVPTVGIKVVLVTSAKVPDETVYTFLKTLMENFDAFKEQHNALRDLDKASMAKDLFAPLHDGALRYFAEAGLV